MVSVVLWLLFGALVGWLASIVMNRNGSMGMFANIAVGIVGAAIGGYLFNRAVAPDILSIASLFTAFVGATLLLLLVNLLTRGRAR